MQMGAGALVNLEWARLCPRAWTSGHPGSDCEILASRSPGKPQTLSSVRALAGTNVVSLMRIPSNLIRTVRLTWMC